MKRSTNGGLVGVLATACLLALGVTPAGATVICRSAADGDAGRAGVQCPDGSEYVGGLTGNLRTANNATFTTSVGTITCNYAPVTGQITDSGGATPGNGGDGIPNGNIATIDWQKWTDADMDGQVDPGEISENCPTTIFGAPTASFAAVDTNGAGGGFWDNTARWQSDNLTGAPNGTLTFLDVKAAATINFAVPIVCTYVGDEDGSGSGTDRNIVADFYNTNNGDKVVFTNAPLRIVESSGSCPSTARFSAQYYLRGTGNIFLYLREDDA
jgi:hypothetical protein